MGKRMKRLMMACALMLAGCGIGTAAYASAVHAPYLAEQAIGKAPDVDVYMTGSKISTKTEITGSMEGITFTEKEKICTFEESGEELSYIILMDNSGSVNETQFEETKKELVKLRKSLKENDEMTLYTVGTNDPAGEKTLVFSRVREKTDKKDKKSDCAQIEEIPYLRGADSRTVLYRSLNQILQEQESPKKRTVVLVITDGEDDSKGKDIDHVSTAETVKNASVPVYGILLNRKPPKSSSAEDQDEKIAYTRNKILAEKNCRGYYCDCSMEETEESVQQAFETLNKLWQEETYVIRLRAETNRAPGRGTLELTADHAAADTIALDYSDYEEDKDAPGITGIVEEVSGNAITFSVHDQNGVNLTDVKNASNYLVQSKTEKGKGKDQGKSWAVESVNAVAKGKEVQVTLTMKEKLYNGDYILKCSNIRDQSQDENAMEAEAEFSITQGLDAKKAAMQDALQRYWWIGLILLILVIGIILIILIRKKKVVGIEPEELEKADSRKIFLTITDRAGVIKEVEWNVEGSLFVGRSSICNIYFDDDRLSKQHFVVEVNKMGCYIEDLESTNGTFVNGVKISSRRMLLDGDVINAGREKIVFHIPKQQPEQAMEDAEQ